MNYISNRNHGCRIKEISINGCKSLILENDVLHILILLDKGADIVEFVYKPSDTDFMWRSPSGLDLINQNKTSNNYYVGGWYECFPNAGMEDTYKSLKIPFYGDIRFLPWEYSVLNDTYEEIKLKLFIKSNVMPLLLERIVTIKLGSTSFHMDEKVTNLSESTMEFTWAHHPNIGRPFLSEKCVIEMPECDIYSLVKDESGKMCEVEMGQWPYAGEGEETIDLRGITPYGSDQYNHFYLKNIKGNTAIVRSLETGLGFQFSWDEKVFKNILLWRAFDSKNWMQTFGHRYILCFLVMSSRYNLLSDTARLGDQIKLDPDASIETWVEANIIHD